MKIIHRNIMASNKLVSSYSFDFSYDEDYDMDEIEGMIYRIMEDEFGFEVIGGIDFRSVDYSNYPEFDGIDISQCGFDFSYISDYSDKEIDKAIAEGLVSLGYTMIGSEFYSIN